MSVVVNGRGSVDVRELMDVKTTQTLFLASRRQALNTQSWKHRAPVFRPSPFANSPKSSVAGDDLPVEILKLVAPLYLWLDCRAATCAGRIGPP